MEAIRIVEAGDLKKDRSGFRPGDTVKVMVKVIEGAEDDKAKKKGAAAKKDEDKGPGFRLQAYEGVDERVSEQLVDEELSIGDYVLTGGEPAALVVADAVTRLLPGVLGDEDAPAHDSFARGLLEHPQYTRPEVFRGAAVPDVLRSGDHGRIARWRTLMSLWRTWQRRPDLLETADLTPEEQKWTDAFRQGRTPADLLD